MGSCESEGVYRDCFVVFFDGLNFSKSYEKEVFKQEKTVTLLKVMLLVAKLL